MTTTTMIIESLVAGHDVSDARKDSLAKAIELGADDATLIMLRDATRLNRLPTILLPSLRYEHLSRGRGWCRQGHGESVVWAERVTTDGRTSYRVGPGRWSVGATDGYTRKDTCDWGVRHVAVGAETWTIAD